MTDPIPAEAVEAAARALDAAEYDDPDRVTEAEWAAVSGAEREFYLSAARRALTAAAPHIAAQATAQVERDYMTRSRTAGEYLQEANRLRAGIEALRDEWRVTGLSSKEHRMSRFTYTECADALDALLREGE